MLLREQKTFNENLFATLGYSFSSIQWCVWTLLLAGTLMLDNSAPLMTAMLTSDDVDIVIAGVLFIFFVFLAALLILQMLIGVLCDVVSQISQDRKDVESIGLIRQELLGYLRSIDKESDGMISKSEIETMFGNQTTLALFRKLKINKVFFEQLSDLTFHDSSSEVPLKNILELLLMCRGDNGANVNIIASTVCLVTNHFIEMMSRLNNMGFGIESRALRNGHDGAALLHSLVETADVDEEQ
jgi:hypothetical protein